jgi:hypothetical protein
MRLANVNGPVYLRHFADRLEISNPGGFFGDVTPQNILGHEPVLRNRLLAESLQKTRMVERAGMGVKRMFHILLSYGKEPPSYESGPDFVRLTLRSGRLGVAITGKGGVFTIKKEHEYVVQPWVAAEKDVLNVYNYSEKTFPVGLLGVFRIIALVLLLNFSESSFGSKDQSGSRRVTNRGLAPQRIVSGP